MQRFGTCSKECNYYPTSPIGSFGSGQQGANTPAPRHTMPSSWGLLCCLAPRRFGGLPRPPPKSSYFFWLALYGRLWTSDQRRKHDLQSEADCALCGQEDETYDHLLAFLRLHHGRLVPPSRSRWSSAPSAGQHDAHLQLVAMHTGNGS